MTIAVTGGNGEFGNAVLEALIIKTDEPIVATVRDQGQTHPLAGVEYRPGDFDQPDVFLGSLAGVDTLLINATFFGADPSRRLPRVSAAIQASADAGVDQVVLTSWPDLEHATLPAVQDYRQLEALVERVRPGATVLRLGYGLADAIARDIMWGQAEGELVAPAAGARVTPAAVSDLAEAAATTLTQGGHEAQTYELTGPDTVTWTDLAALAQVAFREVNNTEYRDYLNHKQLPEAAADQLIELYTDFRGPWASAPTPTLEQLIGHPPVPGIEAIRRRVTRSQEAS
jgi:NAD(P)H dehydrogenase (quinone)